jgi:hypothetical protein
MEKQDDSGNQEECEGCQNTITSLTILVQDTKKIFEFLTQHSAIPVSTL